MKAAAERSPADDLIEMAYDALEGAEDLMAYHARHGTPSLLVLTQHSPHIAIETARLLREHIDGKRVVEVGAGVGFLAIEMAKRAKSVIAIESDPAWSWVFTRSLLAHKPANLSWVFGTAESVADIVRGDIAVVCTRSGHEAMRKVALRMAPRVIFPLDELGAK
ncbi:MAG: hypothetical protein EPN91_09375 [Salinibacterium sp.]|nr:MAG: hypothetical protein EPN91_09375 [Salinibacterium sp.]